MLGSAVIVLSGLYLLLRERRRKDSAQKASFKHAQPDGYWYHATDQPVAQTPVLTPNALY